MGERKYTGKIDSIKGENLVRIPNEKFQHETIVIKLNFVRFNDFSLIFSKKEEFAHEPSKLLYSGQFLTILTVQCEIFNSS